MKVLFTCLIVCMGFFPLAASLDGAAGLTGFSGSNPDGPCYCNRILSCFRAELCLCRRPFGNKRGCECTEPGKLFYTTCDGVGLECCGDPDDPWDRRLEAPYKSMKGDEEEYHAIIDRCGKFDFDTHIFVDKHLYLIASPKAEAIVEGCPHIVTHANFGSDEDSSGSTTQKEILVWDYDSESPFSIESIASGSLLLGTYTLSSFARAVQEADPASPGNVYDVVTNNCGGYMVSLASELGMKIDTRVTSFIASRLLEHSGKALADRVRNSVNYLSLFHDRNLRAESADDEELIHLLVDSHASRLY